MLNFTPVFILMSLWTTYTLSTEPQKAVGDEDCFVSALFQMSSLPGAVSELFNAALWMFTSQFTDFQVTLRLIAILTSPIWECWYFNAGIVDFTPFSSFLSQNALLCVCLRACLKMFSHLLKPLGLLWQEEYENILFKKTGWQCVGMTPYGDRRSGLI